MKPSSGGLATGLARAHRDSAGLWVDWSGIERPLEAAEEALMGDAGLLPLELRPCEVERDDRSLSNRAIWPLFHGFTERVVWDEDSWRVYRRVNERFCEALISSLAGDERVLVQDDHLALLPSLLRARISGLRIGHFMHIPRPSIASPRSAWSLPCGMA